MSQIEIQTLIEHLQKIEKKECPFVSKNGPECPQCGAPPTKVNIDEPSRTGVCDDCGHRFRISNKKKK